MANRWNRNTPYGGGYVGSGGVGVGFYMTSPAPADRRPYNTTPVSKPFYGGYRDDYRPRSERREDFRGGKRGPPKGKSPVEKRYHDTPPSQRRDHRPFGKRPPPLGKYEIKLPKTVFNVVSKSVAELRHAYPRLNVAADVYECDSSWCRAFPLHSPFKLGSGSDYHVFHRDVDPPTPADTTLLNPPDADYSYSARVMLMACPNLGELYKNTLRVADDAAGTDKVAPGKNMHFLVGGRAKSETMAIGGPWSPSLDGSNPAGDPKTLINTAVRTFKGFTGVDLSSCTEWIRFMELRYYRYPDTKAPAFHGDDEDRVVKTEGPEVVVFFIPNATHLIPSEEKWAETKSYYSGVLQKLLSPEEKPKQEVSQEVTEPDTSIAEASMDETEETAPRSDAEPTHYSKLDINSLKVNELRNELAARKLDTKGLKVNLVSRLQSALDEERKADAAEESKVEAEEKKAEQTPAKATSPTAQPKEETKELSEKDRRRLERLYRLNEKPSIIIHPNRAARGGRFDCHRVSLFSLLDYRTEEQKEHNFEVSLFAEQFHEMLQRDCAFQIFKAIHDAPEKEHKAEQDGKVENGIEDDEKEPDLKRRREENQTPNEHTEEGKVRKLRRTTRPDLLFAFTYFDLGHAGYIRDHDLCELLHLLDLRYSKSQMRKFVSKVVSRRDHVEYHNLTDSDIVEGDEKDVVTIQSDQTEDPEVTKMLALGNRALFDTSQPPAPSKIVVGGANAAEITARLEKAEEQKQKMQFKFFQIKDELEKTRTQLNSFKDTEDNLREQCHDLSSRLKTEQRQTHDNKTLLSTYGHLLHLTKEKLETVLNNINKQFEKEKARRDAEKAAAEAEKVKKENDGSKTENPVEVGVAVDNAHFFLQNADKTDADKSEEKEWEVVDTV